MTEPTIRARLRGDRITRWLLIAIAIYSGLLVTLLNVHILSTSCPLAASSSGRSA